LAAVSKRIPWLPAIVAGSFLLYLAFFTTLRLTTLTMGIYVSNRGGFITVSGIVPHSSAEAAGLMPGDKIVGLNGLKISARADWIALQTNVTAQRPTDFEILRDGQPRVITLTVQRDSWSNRTVNERIRFVMGRSGAFIMLATACLVAFARPDNVSALIGALLFATLAVIDPSPPTGSAAAWRALPGIAGLLLWIPALSQLLSPGFLFTFCATFPRKLIRSRVIWALIWIPNSIAFALFARFTFFNVYDPERALGMLPDRIIVGISTMGVVYFAGGIVAMTLNYRLLDDANEKRRVRLLVAGVMAAMVVSPLTFLPAVFPATDVVFGSIWWALFAGILVFWFFPLSFAYSVLRHRLFDIRIIVRQGLQYALARRGLLLVIPALAVILLLDLLDHSDQTLGAILRSRGWFYAVVAGLAAIVYNKRQTWLDHLDRKFFRDHYDANQLLREVIEDARTGRHLQTIGPSVLSRIQSALHPVFVAVLQRRLDDDRFRPVFVSPADFVSPQIKADSKLAQLAQVAGKPLQVSAAEKWISDELAEYAGIDLVAPINANTLLILGRKRSEEPYSREDENLLATIAASLAIASDKPAESVTKPHSRKLANRYRLDECIGRGGMGAVYAGHDESLERPVAIKLIRQDLAADSDTAARFHSEAKAIAAITHRNVVTIYDFGIEEQQPFIVMELLKGRTLRTELEANKVLPSARALEILIPVCDAVEEAHDRGIIHRDLKPENIFLAVAGKSETIKVLDFGLAKTIAANKSNAPTAVTQLAGTPHYMAPEQLMGESPKPSWDLWALSVVACEILTGQRPTLGNPAAGVTEARLQKFFRTALDPNPARRPNSISVLRSELQQALADN
jgi:hypothetical protein